MLHNKPFDWPYTVEAATMVHDLIHAAYQSARSGRMVKPIEPALVPARTPAMSSISPAGWGGPS